MPVKFDITPPWKACLKPYLWNSKIFEVWICMPQYLSKVTYDLSWPILFGHRTGPSWGPVPLSQKDCTTQILLKIVCFLYSMTPWLGWVGLAKTNCKNSVWHISNQVKGKPYPCSKTWKAGLTHPTYLSHITRVRPSLISFGLAAFEGCKKAVPKAAEKRAKNCWLWWRCYFFFTCTVCVSIPLTLSWSSFLKSVSIRLTITASCPMDLQYFPMDRQLCYMEIESCK